MKLIYLGGKYGSIVGNYAQVSDEDYEELNQYKWYAQQPRKEKLYAVRMVNRKLIKMHRIILKLTSSDSQGDHIDGNGLNNQRNNLRIATHSQNMANRKANKRGISKYLGVSARKRNGQIKYWQAQCCSSGIKYTKIYKTEVEAAVSYNEMALKYHGEFAKLNIIQD